MSGVDAAVHCANVITQQAAEIEHLRRQNAVLQGRIAKALRVLDDARDATRTGRLTIVSAKLGGMLDILTGRLGALDAIVRGIP